MKDEVTGFSEWDSIWGTCQDSQMKASRRDRSCAIVKMHYWVYELVTKSHKRTKKGT